MLKKDIRLAKRCKQCQKRLSGKHHFLCDACWTQKNKKQKPSI